MGHTEASTRPAGGSDGPVDPAIVWDAVRVDRGGTRILTDVSITVPRGTWLGLLGPNGAGKSTLLGALAGHVPITAGSMAIDGRSTAGLTNRRRARAIAVVVQHPVIPPGMATFDYVLLGRSPHQGLRFAPSLSDRRRAFAMLQRLDLEPFSDRAVDSLSGGERQRVVLARALVQDTGILLLDEPTSALDVGHQLDVLELVADIRTEQELTVVSSVHDLSLAGQFADTIAVLARGRLVGHGDPADVLTPALLAEHWGVDATTAVDDHGAVSVIVRRRRTSRPGSTEPIPTDPLTNDPPATCLVSGPDPGANDHAY